jgi:hypothetical protein
MKDDKTKRADDSLRIEVTEKFCPLTEEEQETQRNLKQPITYEYRRIYLRLTDIFAPKEIPNKKTICQIELYDGTIMTVKGSYDDICDLIDEREKLLEQTRFDYE